MRRKEVLSILSANRQDIVDRFDVESIYLFGSVARDEASAKSDVDLLVEFRRPIGMLQFIDLKQYLEGLLGCEVDLGTKRSLKLGLKDHILHEAIHVA